MNIIIIRVWNQRENVIKIKNKKHVQKLNEINETFDVNKTKIHKFRIKINKRFVVNRNRKVKFKKKIKKNFSNDQIIDVFFEINYDKKIDFFQDSFKEQKVDFEIYKFFLSFTNTKIQTFWIIFDTIFEKINT